MFRAIEQALGGLGSDLAKQLKAIQCTLADIRRQLGMEYGRPTERTHPYNPERQPYARHMTVSEPVEINVQQELQGALAVRGTVINQGDGAALLITTGLDGSRSGPIVIAPKSVVDITWIVAALDIRPADPAQPTEIQVILQGGG